MSDVGDMQKYLLGVSNYQYFQLIQDEGSRYKWVYLLKHKSDSNANSMNLMSELLAQGHRIKKFTSDGGGEFLNNALKGLLKLYGIKLVPTHSYTPEENALVEKLNGVLVNKVRVTMHAADLPLKLWPEVLQYVVDIDNMTTTRALNGKTPSEKLFGKKPDTSKIRVCGCVGFVCVQKQVCKHKLSPKANPALLLVFARSAPGYRLLHLRTGKIVEARDVQFREDATVSSKYLNKLLLGRHHGENIPYAPLPVEYIATGNVRDGAYRAVENSLPKDLTTSHGGSAFIDDAHGPGGAASSSSDESEVDEVHDTRATGHGAVPAHGSAQPLAPGRRRLRRQRHGDRSPPPATRVSTRVKTSNVRLRDYHLLVEEKFVGDPATVEEALNSPQREEWLVAMKAEYDALIRNNTWKLIDPHQTSRLRSSLQSGCCG
ncbi:hypothetical protein PF008_g13196 [Phytophthora fragariae]|uniref:Integrase catalytic domain-containing protein n=1 Tax=Phytophthora fragariae TaxID=53985 RepID=A0A6G0RKM6_9STRA|nr:hypothetical protein PF008_g13196 [Phytophthora fragariae]